MTKNTQRNSTSSVIRLPSLVSSGRAGGATLRWFGILSPEEAETFSAAPVIPLRGPRQRDPCCGLCARDPALRWRGGGLTAGVCSTVPIILNSAARFQDNGNLPDTRRDARKLRP
jgi:hypothetical protein